MRLIKSFFHSLKGTFTSPRYYDDILKAKFGFSLKYFFLFFFFYSLIGATYVYFFHLAPYQEGISKIPDQVSQIYPEGLVVSIKEGKLSTNSPQPVIIPFSLVGDLVTEITGEVLPETEAYQSLSNLLVIDPQATIDKFGDYKTIILATENSISYLNDQGNMETVSLKDVDAMEINQEVFDKFIGSTRPLFENAVLILTGLIFLVFLLFAPGGVLISLLFFSVLLVILSKVLNRPLSYKKSYQMGLHLATIATTLNGIFIIANFHPNIPFFNIILMLILAGLIITQNRGGSSEPAPQSTSI